ncbi:MAG: hypothetical protein COB46_00010 [Rhodospirillaceae bacterium]|nr:MAG: hypothetical protein COB46_00010 [Rhodospirillaceae bacterium]
MHTSLVDSILKDRFGLDALRPLQQEIIDRVLGGGDALIVMPTGSGKSLCFQLPALVKHRESGGLGGVGLVFSPLIALMEDQVSALKKRGIRAEYVNSTVPPQERRKRYKKLAAGEYELFYATPERMTKPDFREALDQVPGGVNLLAIDECHCHCDASLHGFGSWFQDAVGRCFIAGGRWSDDEALFKQASELTSGDISRLEARGVHKGCHAFEAKIRQHSKLHLHIDNTSVTAAVGSKSGHAKADSLNEELADVLKWLWSLDIEVVVSYVRSEDNKADAASRGFFEL